jgi:uncharacterized protein (TIRG00374 family)
MATAMSERMWDRGLALTALLVAIVTAVSVGLAWHTSSGMLEQVSTFTFAEMFCAALVSYGLRLVRFQYFLSRSGVDLPLHSTFVVQAVGFALSVTPGHVGEVFKLHLIKQRVGTPVAKTAPLLLLDRMTEGGGFFILAVLSGITLPVWRARTPTPSIVLLALVAMLAFALIQRRWAHEGVISVIKRVEATALSRFVPHLQNLWQGMEVTFTTSQIIGGLALSTVARSADGIVVLLAARMMGVSLSLPTAVFILAVSGLTGGVSLLPAGIGATETTMVGLLVLAGASFGTGLGIALTVRLFVLWSWVALGLGVAVALRVRAARRQVPEAT